MTPAPAFIRRTRNPDLDPPKKVERTRKAPGTYELIGDRLVEVIPND